MSEQKSIAFLHDDGYVEMKLVGEVPTDELQTLVNEAISLIEQHGPINLLSNGQHGRIARDARSFSTLMSIRGVPKLRHYFILTSAETGDPMGIAGPSIVTTILTSILGFRPTYIDSEAEARQRASQET